jgi:hypothetical protein
MELAYVTIYASLLCLIPWGCIMVVAALVDKFHYHRKEKNRKYPWYIWQGDKLEPDIQFKWRHEELLGLGFELLGAYSFIDSPKRKSWAYWHPKTPYIFVSLSRDRLNTHNHTEIVTWFDKNCVVMTANGGTTNQVYEKLIINNVATSVTKAIEYHQVVLESELARFGEPLEVTNSEKFLEFAKMFYTEYRHLLMASSFQGEWAAFLYFSIFAGAVGLLALSLMYFGVLVSWQIYLLATVLPIMVAALSKWTVKLEPNVEQRAQKKKAI